MKKGVGARRRTFPSSQRRGGRDTNKIAKLPLRGGEQRLPTTHSPHWQVQIVPILIQEVDRPRSTTHTPAE